MRNSYNFLIAASAATIVIALMYMYIQFRIRCRSRMTVYNYFVGPWNAHERFKTNNFRLFEIEKEERVKQRNGFSVDWVHRALSSALTHSAARCGQCSTILVSDVIFVVLFFHFSRWPRARMLLAYRCRRSEIFSSFHLTTS